MEHYTIALFCRGLRGLGALRNVAAHGEVVPALTVQLARRAAGAVPTNIARAAAGMRPVIEFQFMGFLHSALDQLIAHASRLRHRTRGTLSCPVVYRAPYGGGVKAPEHHSESTEAILSHIPGLRVIIPSSPQLAYHLLKQAIAINDPVVFLEPTKLYRQEADIDLDANIKLGRVQIIRPGLDLTLISWGAQINECLTIAQHYEQEYGIEIQIVDLSSLNPIDLDGLLSAVSKTNNALVVHEAIERGGLGGEIEGHLRRARGRRRFGCRRDGVGGPSPPHPLLKNYTIESAFRGSRASGL